MAGLNPYFVSDDHALATGMLIGALMKAGIPAQPLADEHGIYKPTIAVRIVLDELVAFDLLLDVRPIGTRDDEEEDPGEESDPLQP